MHVGRRESVVDALKLGTYLVSSSRGCHKPHQAVLTAVARLHGDFAGPNGPSFAAYLGLLRGVVSNVRIIAGDRPVMRGRVPETNRTGRVTWHVDSIRLRVDSKLVRR